LLDHGLVLVFLKVEDSEEGIWIGLVAIDLDCRPQQWLRQNQVGQGRDVKVLGIGVEQLTEEVLEAVEIHCWLRVEPFEVDVHNVHLLYSGSVSNLSLSLSHSRTTLCECTSSDSSPSTEGSAPPMTTSPSLSCLRFPIFFFY